MLIDADIANSMSDSHRRRYCQTPTHESAASYTFVSNMNLDMYQFEVLYAFRSPKAKLRPFAVAGLGFSHFGVQLVSGQSALGFSNRFAYNIGGGVKYYISRHWGVRDEIRWSPSHTTQGQSIYCDPFFGCAPTAVANSAEHARRISE